MFIIKVYRRTHSLDIFFYFIFNIFLYNFFIRHLLQTNKSCPKENIALYSDKTVGC